MSDTARAADTIVTGPNEPPALIPDFSVKGRPAAARPTPKQPSDARVITKAKPRPVFRASSTGRRVRGTATWYCKPGVSACHHAYSGGMYAAAGPELRVGAWRGRVVHVCAGARCVDVKLIDWCSCGGSHVIDLYSDAYRQLAPLSTGGQRVTVTW